MSKKVKLRSVDRNVRKNTRAQGKRVSKPTKKHVIKTSNVKVIDIEEQKRAHLEKARAENVVILSTATKPKEPKISQVPISGAEVKSVETPVRHSDVKSVEPPKKTIEPSKKTIKDPLWYIGSGVLWLFDTLRGRTEYPEPVVEESAPEPEPVVEEPAPEPEPVVEEPAPEPEPVVEEPAPEPEPVVEEPVSEPEPIVEEIAPEVALEEPSMDEESEVEEEAEEESETKEDDSDELVEEEDTEDDEESVGIVISGGETEAKARISGVSLAYLTRYARTTARGADRRIKENIKLSKKKESLERKINKLVPSKRATEEDVKRIIGEKNALIEEVKDINSKMEYNLLIASSLERASDEYLYIRKNIDGTVVEGLRRTERINPEEINVNLESFNSLKKKYDAAKMAKESK